MKKITFTCALALASTVTACASAPSGSGASILDSPAMATAVASGSTAVRSELKCGSNISIQQASLFNIGTACVGFDMFTDWAAPKSGVTQIDGSAEADLDHALYLALKGEPSTVTVNFEPDSDKTISIDRLANLTEPGVSDPPIVYWLDRVSDTGGRNVPCRASQPEGLFTALADILFRMALTGIDNMKTYGPAKNYNTLVTFDNKLETRPIIAVKFIPRSEGDPSCGTD